MVRQLRAVLKFGLRASPFGDRLSTNREELEVLLSSPNKTMADFSRKILDRYFGDDLSGTASGTVSYGTRSACSERRECASRFEHRFRAGAHFRLLRGVNGGCKRGPVPIRTLFRRGIRVRPRFLARCLRLQ